MRRPRARNLLRAGAGIAAATWFWSANRTLDLTRVANPIPGPDHLVNAYIDHFWTGDDSVVSIGPVPDICPVMCNVTTGSRTNLAALYGRLKALGQRSAFGGRSSPDGKWLLFDPNDADQAGFLISVDGTKQVTWKRRGRFAPMTGRATWLRRNAGWIETGIKEGTTSPRELVINSYSFPNSSAPTIAPPQLAPRLAEPASEFSTTYEATSDCGLWFARRQKEPWLGPDIRMGVIAVQSGKVSDVELPWLRNEEFLEAEASPDGSKLAWLSWIRGRDASPGRFGWVFSLFGLVRPSEAVLRLTDGHGKGAREIGRVPVIVATWSTNGANSFSQPIGPDQLRWTPSGRYLSFDFHGRLWRLAVD
jgi:hypothetical protein